MNRVAVAIEEGYSPGCVGRIVELHGKYYAEHQGFGIYFEAKVARELGEFCARYTRGRDGLWVAWQDGAIEGSIAIDGSDADCARLRWFIVSDALRGTGVGTRLIQAALDFCRSSGVLRVRLVTFSTLHAALHLYVKHGFRLIHEERGSNWGKEVMEQEYELVLRVT
ncbi:MAG TPA: GNAT family N-acetyltransferase [Usitatibacter sp.]|nr:GNAT family N-acetyltransferase [Usitatibacter sp.]